MSSIPRKISIIGTVGLPANYGGFETLAENLVMHHSKHNLPDQIVVYCSSRNYPDRQPSFRSARLRYIPLNANGAQSIPYDVWSLLSAIRHGSDTIILLGVSGAISLPLIKIFSRARIITNIDGIEWRRAKWKGLARSFLKWSEHLAVKFSDEIIADNDAIADYVRQTYGVSPHVIAYGGDHAAAATEAPLPAGMPPGNYAFSVCRIEPENNVHMILEAFAAQSRLALVMVGNWDKSPYGVDLREQYAEHTHLTLLNPIYDLGVLKTLRMKATCYVHGHSAGGTNPSLVEAMQFGIPIAAYDCRFNRCTTENSAIYFSTSTDLTYLISHLEIYATNSIGQTMKTIAQRRYSWSVVAEQYFNLLDTVRHRQPCQN
jgi:glycosyltransferase involved in cell wall biosynthesis